MKESLTIRPLEVDDAAELSAMLRAQAPEYARFFSPFAFDEKTLSDLLARRERDVYMGMYWEGRMACFFMLRGWDAGYEVPAYGIIIAAEFRGCGMEMLSLDAAKAVCRLRGARRMMLKMHPENISARGVMRKIGFAQTGVEAEGGNIIYHADV